MTLGQHVWVVPEGYIPAWSTGDNADLESHDALCILNASDRSASLAIMIYFEDREPVGPYRYKVAPRRTRHLRINDFAVPAPVPPATAYSSVIQSDAPIVVQYTRLDSRQSANALLSTVAYPAAGGNAA